MSIPHDQGTERSDPEALLPMLWLGAGLVAIVAFTYWLNAIQGFLVSGRDAGSRLGLPAIMPFWLVFSVGERLTAVRRYSK